ncbi:MAG: leucyl aminopeptidase [Neisseriaceae bacterium]
MKIKINKSTIEITNNHTLTADLTVVFSFEHELLINGKKLIKNSEITKLANLKEYGSHHLFSNTNGHFLVLSLGSKSKFNLANYLSSLRELAEYLSKNHNITKLNIVIEEQIATLLSYTTEFYIEQTIFHLMNYLYYFDEQKSITKMLELNQINVTSKNDITQIIKNTISLIDGLFLLRHLANNPSNIVTPSYIADAVKDFGKFSKKVKVNTLNTKEIKKAKMNTFLAVARGSTEEPKFIQLEYKGGRPNSKPIVLVGKGITFDTGGISLKPGENMHTMKYDMCGAATVIAAFLSTVKLELPINLIVLVPTCENMPSGNAIKPGDIVKTLSGQTVEILNTDAEGRLILCDALTYAKKYNPALVIDVATLTGGVIVALGSVASGLYSNNDDLANLLIASANNTNDKVWRLPLFKEYHDMLKSDSADIANISTKKGQAASPTAACFLEKFVDYKWAHLDIAGVDSGPDIFNAKNYNGATGRPFYLLMDFLRNSANKKLN